ncbi:hypothetical protein [Acidovorax sacchari]|uniref:hypothetical protein n=1 Tax=Acidovorax sacchari TaxID=3230736 RepID=UPI0039E6286C
MAMPARSEPPAAPAQHEEEFSFSAWAQPPVGRTQHASASAQRPEPLDTPAASHIRKATTTTKTPSGQEKIRIDFGNAVGSMSTELQAELRRGMRQASPGSTRLQGVDKRLADAFSNALNELGAGGHRLPANPLVTEKAMQLASRSVAREILMPELVNAPRGADIVLDSGSWTAPSSPPSTFESRAASVLTHLREGGSKNPERPDAPSISMTAVAVLEDELREELEKATLSVVGGRVRLDDVDPRLAEAVDSALQDVASQGYGLSNHQAVLEQAKRRAAKTLARSLVGEQLRREASEAERAHAGASVPLEQRAASTIRKALMAPSGTDGKARLDYPKAIGSLSADLQADLRQGMRQASPGSTRLQGIDRRLADAFAVALKEELGVGGNRLPANPLETEKALQMAATTVAQELLMVGLFRMPDAPEVVKYSSPMRQPQPPLASRAASLLAGIREERSRKAERPDASVVNMIAVAVLEEELRKDLEKATLSFSGRQVRLDDVDPRLAEAVDSAVQEEALQGYGLSNHDAVLQQAKRKATKQLAKSLVGEQLRKEASESRQRPARAEPPPAEFSFNAWLPPGSSSTRRS